MIPTLYTRDEAAKMLRVSSKALSKLPIPKIRHTPGGSIFYDERDLIAWLDRQKDGSSGGTVDAPTSASRGKVSVLNSPLARQILAEEQRKRRASMRTSSRGAA